MRWILRLPLAACLLAAGTPPCLSQVPPTFPGVRSLLWVGAHPDDEVIAAPLLGRLCVEERLDCTFLVLTRGEAGRCRLPHGCRPDLGAVRSLEMQRSARLFRATLQLWDLPDGGVGVAGGPLVDRIAALLDAVRPDLVLTFDPRHGSTCHPDHRIAAEALIAAVERDARAPLVVLLETRVTGATAAFTIDFSAAAPAAAGTVGFDANQRLAATRLPAWDFLLRAAQSHPSQFEPAALRGFRRVSSRQRVVYFAPAAMALAADVMASCD